MNRVARQVVSVILLLSPVSCKTETDPTERVGTVRSTVGAVAKVSASDHRPIRLQVSIDGRSTELVVPPSRPATVARESWGMRLALSAVARSVTEAELMVGVFPKNTTKAIDLAELKKHASVVRGMKRGEPIVIDPRNTFPADGLGESGPLEIKITWIP